MANGLRRRHNQPLVFHRVLVPSPSALLPLSLVAPLSSSALPPYDFQLTLFESLHFFVFAEKLIIYYFEQFNLNETCEIRTGLYVPARTLIRTSSSAHLSSCFEK